MTDIAIGTVMLVIASVPQQPGWIVIPLKVCIDAYHISAPKDENLYSCRMKAY